MPWIQLFVDAPADETPVIEEVLLSAGALSVTLLNQGSNPLYEPGPGEIPLWKWTRVVGLFAADGALDDIKSRVLSALAGKNLESAAQHADLAHEWLDDQDWERTWLDQYHARKFGESFWVGPVDDSWAGEGQYLHLDPGLAFGTGTHPTTALCLEWLASEQWDQELVVDFGCGSGILSIAACLLGAKKVIAVDHDPQALIATRDNAQKNKVEDKIEAKLAKSYAGELAGLLIANILANPLILLAPTFAGSVRPGGKIMLSGILSHQANKVASAYSQWFKMEPPVESDGWVRLVGERFIA